MLALFVEGLKFGGRLLQPRVRAREECGKLTVARFVRGELLFGFEGLFPCNFECGEFRFERGVLLFGLAVRGAPDARPLARQVTAHADSPVTPILAALLETLEPDQRAWLRFHQRVKPRAYAIDGTRGTTPVYQELRNLADAKSAAELCGALVTRGQDCLVVAP